MILMAGLLGSAIYGFRYVPDSFFPNSTRPQFKVDFWFPEGYHIDDTEKAVQPLEQWMLEQKEVTAVNSFIGGGALRFMLVYSPESNKSCYAQLLVTVKNYSDIPELINRAKAITSATVPDAKVDYNSFVFGPSTGGKIAARIQGNDPDVLRKISLQIEEIMRSHPNTQFVRNDWRQKVKVIQPVYAESEARRLGITRSTLSQALLWGTNGVTSAVYREKDKLIPIISRPPASERGGMENLRDLRVHSSISNAHIPIDQLVKSWDIKFENPRIQRRNRVRTITVQCDPIVGVASRVFTELRPLIEAIKLPDGYSLEWGGE
jgi:multidrug efflux pump subunit AcrB